MRRTIIACLIVLATFSLHAQSFLEDDTDSLENIWTVSEQGNLILLKDCDGQELARSLNTSTQIIFWMLGEQGHANKEDDSVVLCKGDSINVDYGLSLAPDTLSGMGKLISCCLDNNLDKYLFSNYWLGKGDIEMTSEMFAGVLLCLRQNPGLLPSGSDTSVVGERRVSRQVSFYKTRYEESFGSATVYIDSDNRVVGFADVYDFDSKRWGVRPIKYEFYVRIVSLLSPASATSFRVYFNEM